MEPREDMVEGEYTLEATYLNRVTGETYPIEVPGVTVNINNNAPVIPAPELDLVTQMRVLATKLREGSPALDPIFDEIGRINQYDPLQDYVVQGELALEYRLNSEPDNLDWAYGFEFVKSIARRCRWGDRGFAKSSAVGLGKSLLSRLSCFCLSL